MMPQPIKAYVRIQQVGPVVGNVILCPLLAWLGNRKMESMTLLGDNSIVIDTAVTSVIASLLVTLFAVSGVHRDLKGGRITVPEGLPPARGILSRLPRDAWALGLILGFAIAVVLVAITLTLFHLFAIDGIPFRSFLVIKAVYTGLIGLFVARCVVLRQLIPAPPASG